MVEKNLTEGQLNFYLNQLKPSTHYTFEVSGLTEVGKGKFSTATIQSGVEPVLPSPPSRLAVSNIEPFSSGKCHLTRRLSKGQRESPIEAKQISKKYYGPIDPQNPQLIFWKC